MRKHANDRLQGALDLLVLKTLASQRRMHGYALTLRIEQISESVLRLEEGSLYPALHRMTQSGWLRAEWGASENNAALVTIPSPHPAASSWRRKSGAGRN
jgi:PadR family transcriptional regulator, regulatory protein PadR